MGTVGGIAGRNLGIIENSYCETYINGSNTLGGFVGNNSGTISGCNSSGMIYGTGNQNGGFAGVNAGRIENSYSEARVEGIEEIGGFTGYNCGVINDCYSLGGVFASGNNIGGFIGHNSGAVENSGSNVIVLGNENTGGFVGWNHKTTYNNYIKNCYSANMVKANMYAGGFAGVNDSEISASFCITETQGEGYIGGFVGYAIGQNNITNSYVHGKVTGFRYMAGGFAGSHEGTLPIQDCYSTCYVDFSNAHGLFADSWVFAGNIENQSSLINCFFERNNTYPNDIPGDRLLMSTEISSTQIKERYTFDWCWDFNTIWSIPDYCKSPYLQWQRNDDIDGLPKWMWVMLQPETAASEFMDIENNLWSWYYAAFHGHCDQTPGYPAPAPKSPDSGNLLDIDEVKDQSINIYPNPTTGIVNIQGENLDIKVHDAKGMLIISTKDKTVDLSAYSSGIYIFNINGKVQKVIKQ